MIRFFEYFFFENIIGIVVLASPILLVGFLISRFVGGRRVPIYVAAAVSLVVALAAMSAPRLLFEQRAIAQATAAPWLRLAKCTRWGALAEPLTWFYAPCGHLHFVGPESPVYDLSGGDRQFQEIFFGYGEESSLFISDVDCDTSRIHRSAPDADGIFRYLSETGLELDSNSRDFYCEHDWTHEVELLRQAIIQHRSLDVQ